LRWLAGVAPFVDDTDELRGSPRQSHSERSWIIVPKMPKASGKGSKDIKLPKTIKKKPA
jgi:hypothetical protein